MSVKKKKIIFICTGNTCRSPMAELLLKKILLERGWKGIEVTSAGIQAKRGDTVNPKSKFVLEENGISCEEFKSRKLTDKMLKDAYAIVCMTEKHREYLLDARWNAMRKAGEEDFENTVYSFYELTGYEVMDPYGKDVDCYRYVFQLLQSGMSALIEKLAILCIAQKPKKRGRPKKSETEK